MTEPIKKQFAGLTVHVENPAGTMRTGTDSTGKAWATPMVHDYGYIPKATGGDGEGLDAYLGPKEDAPDVHIINQNNIDGGYDEQKAMLGFPTQMDAKTSYLAHTGNDPKKIRSITSMPVDNFKSMLTNAEPGSVHWKKKHGRDHATTALFARVEWNGLSFEVPEKAKDIVTLANENKLITELARARLAKCPTCKSHDVTRLASKSKDEGPTDSCDRCGRTWPHKVGTITASMHEMARQDGYGEGPFPDVPGTTDSAGWTDDDPPVTDADGNPIEDEEGGLTDDDQTMLDKMPVMASLSSRLGQKLFSE